MADLGLFGDGGCSEVGALLGAGFANLRTVRVEADAESNLRQPSVEQCNIVHEGLQVYRSIWLDDAPPANGGQHPERLNATFS